MAITNKYPLIQNRDFVIVSIQPWYYELGSNCKNIAIELSKHNRVLYINIPITKKTFYAKKRTDGIKKHCEIIRKKTNSIEQIDENLWQFYPTTLIESINWLPVTGIFKLINKFNNKRFAKDIRYAINRLHFNNVILLNDNDIYNGFYLKELLSPKIYLYYMRDFLQGYDFWKKHSSVLEPQLIKKVDIVVTNSPFYQKYCTRFNHHCYYIGQGCKLDLFDVEKKHNVPADVLTIPHPRIGYVGALDSSRLDHTIIKTIAKHRLNWQIILAGPEDTAFEQSSLHNLSNVHFLGRKQIDQLPAYVNAFDVCINPQQINLITNGNYPLKIDEYLSMGKPAVATKTETMHLFSEYVELANTPEEYPHLIEKLLAKKTSHEELQKKISFAKSHTWENSIQLLYEAIHQYEK